MIRIDVEVDANKKHIWKIHCVIEIEIETEKQRKPLTNGWNNNNESDEIKKQLKGNELTNKAQRIKQYK